MSVTKVNADNFPRVESDHMFAAILKDNGGEIGKWMHNREPTPLDHQPVIRQNRDTLYSALIADISKGGTLTIPDGGDRYLSVMVVNQDHFINQVFHDAGVLAPYELTVDDFDTLRMCCSPHASWSTRPTRMMLWKSTLAGQVGFRSQIERAIHQPGVRRRIL
ncbi:MAG: DUF1254 domain-containing protein [Thermomicrobiales bacterium]